MMAVIIPAFWLCVLCASKVNKQGGPSAGRGNLPLWQGRDTTENIDQKSRRASRSQIIPDQLELSSTTPLILLAPLSGEAMNSKARLSYFQPLCVCGGRGRWRGALLATMMHTTGTTGRAGYAYPFKNQRWLIFHIIPAWCGNNLWTRDDNHGGEFSKSDRQT